MQKILEAECAWADVIVAGPGLGQEAYTEYLLETVLSDSYVPIVLDADGLNCVASHPYLTRYFTENIIITPHMGEMSRLRFP
jgi:NAD(P)H-hydrate repair Nnr-like enzyme with NAD(P)H-hydrate dehydratase domain